MSPAAMATTIKALSIKNKLGGIRELCPVDFLDILTCASQLRAQQMQLLVDASILLHVFVLNLLGQG